MVPYHGEQSSCFIFSDFHIFFQVGLGMLVIVFVVMVQLLVDWGRGTAWGLPLQRPPRSPRSRGLQGIQGLQGLQSLQGLQGLLGVQGVQGLQGLQVLEGLQGLQGLKDLQGL